MTDESELDTRLGHSLMYFCRSEKQRKKVQEILDYFGDDDLARAWLIGMNPTLHDDAPLLAICRNQFDEVDQALKDHDRFAFGGGIFG